VNVKIISEMPQVGEVSRIVHMQSLRKRLSAVVASVFVAVVLGLTGAPAATATPAFTSNHMAFIMEPPPPCRGDKPGACPYFSYVQENEQATQ
jgi:hypothetical protein